MAQDIDDEGWEAANAPDPIWLLTAVACIVPAVLAFRLGNVLDGDTYHYVEYWRKLVGGIRHTSSLHEAAPKALPILLFGATYSVTGSFAALTAVSVFTSGLAVAFLVRCVHELLGRAGSRISLVLVSLNPLFVEQALEGSTALLEILFLSWALHCWLTSSGRRPILTGALLLLAGLCRPEVWPLYLAGATASLAFGSLHRPRVAFFLACLSPLAWLAFDGLLTGDPLFSFRDTVDYGSRHTGESVQLGGASLLAAGVAYLKRLSVLVVATSPGATTLLGFGGIILLAKRRPAIAALVTGACLSVFAFYFLPFKSGVPLLSRFLLLPALVLSAMTGPLIQKIHVALTASDSDGIGRPASVMIDLARSRAMLTAVALLAPLSLLHVWIRDTGTLMASITSELTDALDQAADADEDSEGRRYLVSARRKGLAVLQLGVGSDAVSSFLREDSETPDSLAAEFDYIFFDARDLLEEPARSWSHLEAPPAGYRELQFETAPHVRVYTTAP